MHRTHLILASTIALASGAFLLSSNRTPVGPGGVLDSIVEFCEALDRGDARALGACLQDSHHGVLFTPHEDGSFTMSQGDENGALFIDRSRDARAILAEDASTFRKLLYAETEALRKEGWTLTTSIRSIDAACPSGELSYAVAELERKYEKVGEASRVVPVRVTALLRHESSRFRIWHWHASVSEPLQ
jgi:hypothetical protein